MALLVGRHPRTVVADRDRDAVGGGSDVDLDRRRRRVLQTIFDDVGQRLGQIVLGREYVRERNAGHLDRLVRQRFEAFDNPLHERDDVDVDARVEIVRRFHPREDDQLIDELAHPRRFGAHSGGDPVGELGIGKRAAGDDVEVAHHDRERRAKFMPGVGDEALHLEFRRAPLLERRRHGLDRRVVRAREFVVRAPLAGQNRARRKVAQRKALQGQRRFVERPQRGPADTAHAHPERGSAAKHDDPEDQADRFEHRDDRAGLRKNRDRAVRDAHATGSFARRGRDEDRQPILAVRFVRAEWAAVEAARRGTARDARSPGRARVARRSEGVIAVRYRGRRIGAMQGAEIAQRAARAVGRSGLAIVQPNAQARARNALHDRRRRLCERAVFREIEPRDFWSFGGLHGRRRVDRVRRHPDREDGARHRDEHERHDRHDGGAAFHRTL